MVVLRKSEPGIINLNQFTYTPYNNDFGPHTVADIVQMSKILNRYANREQTVQVPMDSKSQSRCLSLLCCTLLHWKQMTIKQVSQAIGEMYLKNLVPFRDAGIGPADYPLTQLDIMRGF